MAIRRPHLRSARTLAPALLVVGMGLAGLAFARSRTPGPSSAPESMAAGSGSLDSAAAAAHAAAGIVPDGSSAAQVFEKRLSALEGRLGTEPDRRDLVLEMARLLHDGHRGREAVAYYRKAIEMDPGDPHAYYDLAALHGELGAWDEAADVLQDRLNRNLGDAVALYDLGAVRANQGRVKEARALLERAREATTDGELGARISQALARLKEG